MSGVDPKALQGAKKVSLGLLPSIGRVLGAQACALGAEKYGAYNWRGGHPINMTTYLDAMERHILAFRDGEDIDPESGVSHLGHIIAGAAILADAIAEKVAVDDRPKSANSFKLVKAAKRPKTEDSEHQFPQHGIQSWGSREVVSRQSCHPSCDWDE
jgi:hypothetical protein